MKLDFVKMHGAGNDFVMLDDRAGTVPWQDHFLMAALATRRTGIGSEGVVLVQPSTRADFRMRFLNPDGAEAEMCGNAARCVAAFAHAIGAAGRTMTMETLCGLMDAELTDQGVRVWMPEPDKRRYNLSVPLGATFVSGHFINTGVPHLVVPVAEIGGVDVARDGRALRRHHLFMPDGANVNFVMWRAPDRMSVRTYERGVEAETGACGTGAVACAVAAVETAGFRLPVRVRTTAGYELLVDGDWRDGKCTGLTLTGPAREVYRGVIDLDTLEMGDAIE
ncbi:MAG: diaminopimelate epimerase [bacterium]